MKLSALVAALLALALTACGEKPAPATETTVAPAASEVAAPVVAAAASEVAAPVAAASEAAPAAPAAK